MNVYKYNDDRDPTVVVNGIITENYGKYYRDNHAAVSTGKGVVTHEPGNFELSHATVVPPMANGEGAGEGEGGDEDEEEDGISTYKPLTKLTWKVTICAWALLAFQGLVTGVLFLNGGGRTAALRYPVEDGVVDIDNPECLLAEGKPGVAEAVALRAVTAVISQLIIFCVSDLGLLKPHEAMWVIFAYFMRFCGKITECCCGVMATLPVTETEVTERDGNGQVTNQYTTKESCALECCVIIMIWVMLPASVVWSFTAFPATLNLMAVCDLVLAGAPIYWFRMGSLMFLILANLIFTCVCDSWRTGSIVPFARAFVVVDSLTIGATAVWGNYVQSGVVAGVFALLPLYNLFLTGLELNG